MNPSQAAAKEALIVTGYRADAGRVPSQFPSQHSDIAGILPPPFLAHDVIHAGTSYSGSSVGRLVLPSGITSSRFLLEVVKAQAYVVAVSARPVRRRYGLSPPSSFPMV